MRKISILLFGIILLALNQVTLSEETISYSNTYKGLKVRVSKLSDMINILGQPLKTTGVNATIKYYYPDVHITLNGKTDTVNTIIIFDPNYIDPNGLQVGDQRWRVQSRLGSDEAVRTIVDKNNGILYWFENDKVSKIVLAGKLLKEARKKK